MIILEALLLFLTYVPLLCRRLLYNNGQRIDKSKKREREARRKVQKSFKRKIMKQYGRIIALLKEYIFTKSYNGRNEGESKFGERK